MRRPLIRAALIGILALSASGSALAQFEQYTAPGGPEGRPEDRKAQLEKAVKEARLRLGPVRIAPWVAVKDAAYVRNLVGNGLTERPDWTATVGAGARAYLHTGPKVIWTAYALPEYVWWRQQTAQRRLNDHLGADLFAFWNRLTLTAGASRQEAQRILTPEVLRLANGRVDRGSLALELRLSAKVSAFATGLVARSTSLADRANDPEELLLEGLDREERVVRGGLRWRPLSGWQIGLGAERSAVTFLDRLPGAIDRGNAGTAPVAEVLYDHGRLFVQADLAARSLAPTAGSSFVAFHKVTGSGAVGWKLTLGAELFVYGNRNLVYSILPQYSYLDDQRLGISLHVSPGRNLGVRVFVEGGREDYTPFSPLAPRRIDDLSAFGGSVRLGLGRYAALTLQGGRTRFDSNLSGADRTFTTLGFAVGLTTDRP
jgi:hypothetical protein